MVRVIDLGDSPKVFHDLPRQVEDTVELLLLRMPLALSRCERSGPVQQEEQFTPNCPGLSEDASHGNLTSVRDGLIGMTRCGELIHPGIGCNDGGLLIGNSENVILTYERLEVLDGLKLLLIWREDRILA